MSYWPGELKADIIRGWVADKKWTDELNAEIIRGWVADKKWTDELNAEIIRGRVADRKWTDELKAKYIFFISDRNVSWVVSKKTFIELMTEMDMSELWISDELIK